MTFRPSGVSTRPPTWPSRWGLSLRRTELLDRPTLLQLLRPEDCHQRTPATAPPVVDHLRIHPGTDPRAYGVTASGMTGKARPSPWWTPTHRPPCSTMPTSSPRSRGTNLSPRAVRADPSQLVQRLGRIRRECGGAPGWYGEESLDVEAVHGQAPDADVRYVAAPAATTPIWPRRWPSSSTTTWPASSPIRGATWPTTPPCCLSTISSSRRERPKGSASFSRRATTATSHRSRTGSTADQVDYPTSSPWVTSVGGTSLAIGAQNNYEFETSWGDRPRSAHSRRFLLAVHAARKLQVGL